MFQIANIRRVLLHQDKNDQKVEKLVDSLEDDFEETTNEAKEEEPKKLTNVGLKDKFNKTADAD